MPSSACYKLDVLQAQMKKGHERENKVRLPQRMMDGEKAHNYHWTVDSLQIENCLYSESRLAPLIPRCPSDVHIMNIMLTQRNPFTHILSSEKVSVWSNGFMKKKKIRTATSVLIFLAVPPPLSLPNSFPPFFSAAEYICANCLPLLIEALTGFTALLLLQTCQRCSAA